MYSSRDLIRDSSATFILLGLSSCEGKDLGSGLPNGVCGRVIETGIAGVDIYAVNWAQAL